MKYRGAVLLIFCCVVGCKKETTTESKSSLDPVPRIAISDTNYSATDFSQGIPFSTSLLQSFSKSYSGKYSDELKGQLISYIQVKSSEIGANRQELDSCLQVTRQLRNGLVSLPMEAERAKYEGQDCWLFSFIWGVQSDDLGHYRCFAISTTSYDTLAFRTCK